MALFKSPFNQDSYENLDGTINNYFTVNKNDPNENTYVRLFAKNESDTDKDNASAIIRATRTETSAVSLYSLSCLVDKYGTAIVESMYYLLTGTYECYIKFKVYLGETCLTVQEVDESISISPRSIIFNDGVNEHEFYHEGNLPTYSRFRGVSSTTPSDPIAGDIWIDTTSGSVPKIYDGSSWITLT